MKTKILWASAHDPTLEQLREMEEAGEVSFLKKVSPELFQKLTNLQIDSNLRQLAEELVSFLRKKNFSMLVQPAGSPAFLFVLGTVMKDTEFPVFFAHSKRVSKDVPQPDGTIKKVSTFRHEGWIKYFPY